MKWVFSVSFHSLLFTSCFIWSLSRTLKHNEPTHAPICDQKFQSMSSHVPKQLKFRLVDELGFKPPIRLLYFKINPVMAHTVAVL